MSASTRCGLGCRENQHRQSGLWQRVLEQGVTMREAELQTIRFL